MMIDLTFWLFYHVLKRVESTKKGCGVNQNWSAKTHALSFASEQTLKRVLNTLLALKHQLQRNREGLSTKRLSSHDCENLFGLYRATNSFKSTWESVQHFVGHLSLQTEIRERLGLGYRARGRQDYAGCVISEETAGIGITMLANPSAFALGFLGVCSVSPDSWCMNVWGPHQAVFSWFRENLSDRGTPSGAGECSPVKGCAIKNRLVNFAKD